MILALTGKKIQLHPHLAYAVFGAAYLLLAALELGGYIPWTSVNFILGVIGLPLTMQHEGPAARSRRFYWFSVVFGILSFLVPLKTVLFLAMVAALLSIAEEVRGKVSLLTVLTLSFMSPTMQYLAGIFSFPIRLALTHAAGRILNASGDVATTAGNVITFRGYDYSVDPACMGLKMLLTSLLCGIFIIAIYERRQHKLMRRSLVFVSLLAVFLMNICSNIIRILILVYFDIRPENKMHEVTGLVCLAVYVLLPSAWLIRTCIRHWGKPAPGAKPVATPALLTKTSLLHGGLVVLLLCSCIGVNRGGSQPPPSLPHVPGYTASFYDQDVLQYKSASALVYIKKINGVFCSEHNPVMCWLGAGYVFESIRETKVNGVTVYEGTLQKGRERLFTAWWYDNGARRTLSQLQWRLDVLKGQRQYSVVNVTAATQDGLEREIRAINVGNVFRECL